MGKNQKKKTAESQPIHESLTPTETLPAVVDVEVEEVKGKGVQVAEPPLQGRAKRRARASMLGKKQIARILASSLRGNTRREVAILENCSTGAVQEVINQFEKIFPALGDVEKFREQRSALIDGAQAMALNSLMDSKKHQEATLSQAAKAFEVTHKAYRLETGKSTNNNANANASFFKVKPKPS